MLCCICIIKIKKTHCGDKKVKNFVHGKLFQMKLESLFLNTLFSKRKKMQYGVAGTYYYYKKLKKRERLEGENRA